MTIYNPNYLRNFWIETLIKEPVHDKDVYVIVVEEASKTEISKGGNDKDLHFVCY